MENENLDVFDRAMLFLGQKTFGYKGIEAEFAVIHEGKAASAAEDARVRGGISVSMEDYKQAVINAPSDIIAEKFLAEADAAGFTAWQLAELAGARRELWV